MTREPSRASTERPIRAQYGPISGIQPREACNRCALRATPRSPTQTSGRRRSPVSLREKLAYARRPLARAMGQAGYEALLQRPVLAMENAEPMAGPYPLIVMGEGF